MKLDDLTPEQLTALYHQELKADFPPSELKPLRSMLSLMERGCYHPLGLYEGEQLLGYALIWVEPDVPFALLDYLGILRGKRAGGLGTRLLELLGEHYGHYRGVFGEVEAPYAGDPSLTQERQRRLDFYLRAGDRYAGYDCALFGVHFQVLLHAQADVTAQELLVAHQTIYQRQIPEPLYRRFVQIPFEKE
jgi:hypothetical protein